MLKLFRDTDQLAIVLISFLTLIFWYLDLRTGAISIDNLASENAGPLGDMLLDALNNVPFVYVALCFVLLLTIAYLLVRLNTRFILTMRRTQLPALFFVICIAGFTKITGILLPLISCLLFCFALDRMFVSFKKPRLAYNFFDAAFLVTLGSLFYAPAFLMNIIVFYSLSRLRALSWREWMLAVLGIVAPLFIYHSTRFVVTGSFELSVINRIAFSSGFFFPWDNLVSYFFLSLLGLLLIVASVDIATGFQLKKIIARRIYLIFFAIFILTVAVFFIIRNVDSGVLVFTAVAFAYLFTHYFSLIRFNWFREITFDILLLLVLTKKLMPLFL